MDAAVRPLLRVLTDPDDARLVRVVELRGFGLRDAGDGAVVTGSDDTLEIDGSVLGGLADDAIRAAAGEGRTAFRATVTDREADAAGMVCGGSATLLVSPVADLPSGTADLLTSATPLAVVARADASGTDAVVVRRDVLGDAPPEPVTEAARAMLAAGSTATTTIDHDGDTYVVSAVVPATRCRIIGSGPMAEAIAAQGALLGWTTTIDEDVAAAEAFLATAGPADAIAVLSHDAAVDVPVLAAALRSDIGYIGGMGSRGTQSRRRTALGEAGFGDDDLERVHGPIGLDLGSRTPAETAVAIVAEFLANRSGRTPGRLTDAAGPING